MTFLTQPLLGESPWQNLAVLFAVVGFGDWEPEFAFALRYRKRPPAPLLLFVLEKSTIAEDAARNSHSRSAGQAVAPWNPGSIATQSKLNLVSLRPEVREERAEHVTDRCRLTPELLKRLLFGWEETGEYGEHRLNHGNGEAEKFYGDEPMPHSHF
jgi:hypothetical protein